MKSSVSWTPDWILPVNCGGALLWNCRRDDGSCSGCTYSSHTLCFLLFLCLFAFRVGVTDLSITIKTYVVYHHVWIHCCVDGNERGNNEKQNIFKCQFRNLWLSHRFGFFKKTFSVILLVDLFFLYLSLDHYNYYWPQSVMKTGYQLFLFYLINMNTFKLLVKGLETRFLSTSWSARWRWFAFGLVSHPSKRKRRSLCVALLRSDWLTGLRFLRVNKSCSAKRTKKQHTVFYEEQIIKSTPVWLYGEC